MTINVKPGAFGKAMKTTDNPIFTLFMSLLGVNGIKYRKCSQEESDSVFTFPREWRQGNGQRGTAYQTETNISLEDKHLDIKMEVSELRFDGNLVFAWCGALMLEREDMLDPDSAEAQAIIDIWQEV